MVVMDWTDLDNRTPVEDRIPMAANKIYGRVEFAFDYAHTYSGSSGVFYANKDYVK